MATNDTKRAGSPHDVRMTLGEHLEELRGCVIRSLLALVICCLAFIWPAKYLLALIARPMVLAARHHEQPASFLQTSPVETIFVYIKVVLIFGLIVAAPYILYQFWHFVAVGLYRHEKGWVSRLVPTSVGLFLAGVVFMYVFVLLISLNFLIGFGSWLSLPEPKASLFERTILGTPSHQIAESRPAISEAPVVPVLEEDPEQPPMGAVWYNVLDQKLKVRGQGDKTYSLQLLRDDRRDMVTTHFKIGQYLTFVMVLTIAFGLAFQMPLVVLFLARTGIVSVETFRKYRKIVILLIVFTAGLLAPPDPMSHLLLSVPMWLLFELGLWLAVRQGRAERAGGASPHGG